MKLVNTGYEIRAPNWQCEIQHLQSPQIYGGFLILEPHIKTIFIAAKRQKVR